MSARSALAGAVFGSGNAQSLLRAGTDTRALPAEGNRAGRTYSDGGRRFREPQALSPTVSPLFGLTLATAPHATLAATRPVGRVAPLTARRTQSERALTALPTDLARHTAVDVATSGVGPASHALATVGACGHQTMPAFLKRLAAFVKPSVSSSLGFMRRARASAIFLRRPPSATLFSLPVE